MAEKEHLKEQEGKESLLFSLLHRKNASTEEEQKTSARQSLLYNLWKNVSEGFSKGVKSQTEPSESEQTEQVEAEEPKEELFAEDDPLLKLAQAWVQEENAALGDPPKLEKWGPQNLLPDEELLPIHRKLIQEATQVAAKMLQEFQNDEGTLDPINGHVGVLVDEAGLHAYAMLLPPLYGGDLVAKEHIQTILENKQIVFGIDEAVLEKLIEPCYFKILRIANGKPPVDGTDGQIEEIVPTTASIHFVEKANGIIDFKEMNWFNSIEEGEPLCKILPPTPAQNGIDIFGKEIAANEGKPAVPPVGKNTTLSEDGTLVIANIAGEVSYVKGQYHVEQVLTIHGNVDFSTGNLDVRGSVIIKGDVCEGFTVKASSDITVHGMIEGATLISGGNIFAKTGMNGNGKGLMIAKGEISCKFIENGTADAQGNIYLESAINADLSSFESIYIKSGRGMLIGGRVTAMNTIEATSVGNRNNLMTVVSIKPTKTFLAQKQKVEEGLEQTQEELTKLLKGDQGGTISSKEKMHIPTLKLKERQLKQKLEKMMDKLEDMQCSVMRFNTLYPNTVVWIGAATTTSQQDHHQCLVYDKGDEIVFGNL